MARRKRFIESGEVYELCFRVREGLPFVPLLLVVLLLKSSIARTQRDHKVVICHMVWMGNHVHLLIRALDALACKNFYMEVQKKLTDSWKRLLGLSHLSLWEGGVQLAKVANLEKAVERIVYFYLNPAAAGLVDNINEYPSLTTWQQFEQATQSPRAVLSEEVPWIRLPDIPRLQSRVVSPSVDTRLTQKMITEARQFSTLTIAPNAWLAAYGITDAETVGRINAEIRHRVLAGEKILREARRLDRKRTVGVERLKMQPILKAHTPKKKERANFVLASCSELRRSYILKVKTLFAECRRLYRAAISGENVQWPPGVFVPAMPPCANALG